MDGENNGKPYENGWFGKTHYFWKHPGGMIFLEELFPIGAQQAAFCSCLQPDHLVHPLQPRWEGKEPPKLLPQISSNQTKNSRAVQRFTRWWFSNMYYFHPETWGNDPIWLCNIFQMCWNHQQVDLWQGFLPSTLYNPLGLVHVRNLWGAIFEPQIQGWSVYPVIISNLNFQRKRHLFSLG